jgi:DNA-binding response OmpR family regulator
MKRLLYVDDDAAMLRKLAQHIREHFPGIEPLTCQDPVQALGLIDSSLDLLMIDLEMPAVDGKKLLTYAISRGLDKKKIIIVSGRDADYLHEVIPMGGCLCVLSKNETRQMEVLDMILASLEKK